LFHYSSENSTLSKLPSKLTNTPNEMYETNERETGLLKAWRGCFWRESTLSFPPKPLKHSQKVVFSIDGGHAS